MRAPRNHESSVYNIGPTPGGCGPALAVAQKPEFVSFAGGYRRRSAGVQVLLADYNHGPRELGAIGGGVVDEAVTPNRPFAYRTGHFHAGLSSLP